VGGFPDLGRLAWQKTEVAAIFVGWVLLNFPQALIFKLRTVPTLRLLRVISPSPIPQPCPLLINSP
jgi:hypothetical protein